MGDPIRPRERIRWNIKNSTVVLSAMVLLGLGPLPCESMASRPLWPGSHYTEQDRDAAVERGLEYLYKIASNPENFRLWGSDLLHCFYTISITARNERLRKMARRMGQERAREWRHEHPTPPVENALDLYLFVYGARAADGLLGKSDAAVRQRAQEAARHFPPIDFLGFDPRAEAPPSDIPERCPKCNHQNPRGTTICHRCQTPLTFRSRYDVWLDALIRTHAGNSYGVTLGASYAQVFGWITKMRPYPSPARDEDEFNDVSYAVTHVVYTLNDYHRYRLSPAWLPEEFSYLKQNIRQAESYENGELLGEFVDALRAFGLDESAPEIQMGIDYLLSSQNPDGSWGDVDDNDIYTRYHSTWTAVDGLREYSFHGQRLQFPELLRWLQGKGQEEGLTRTLFRPSALAITGRAGRSPVPWMH